MDQEIQKKWVGGICVHEGRVLLIHRINKERISAQEYFMFPGKDVEDDESIETAITKAFSDIGITGTLQSLVYSQEEDSDTFEYYYTFDYLFGEPTPYQSKDTDDDGITDQYYTPIWVALSELDDLIVYPEVVKNTMLEQKEEDFL